MTHAMRDTGTHPRAEVEYIDCAVIGAGVTGIYQLYCLRKAGFAAKIFEAAGVTWYWNR